MALWCCGEQVFGVPQVILFLIVECGVGLLGPLGVL